MASHNSLNQVGTSDREYEKARFAVPHHILRSEVIYGEGFQSPGGLVAFQQTILPQLSLEPGKRLLDIGSGLGGAAFHLVGEYGVEVVGIDLAETMISIADRRRARLDPRGGAQFIRDDVFSDALKPASFDAIYSQDTLMYEAYKSRVLGRCIELLKPGGTLVINDFCYGRSTPDFDHYIEVSELQLITIPAYEETVRSVGFTGVTAQDISTMTADRLQRDLDGYLARVQQRQDIADTDIDHVVERWRRKITLLKDGALAQGLFCAAKPTSPVLPK